MFYQTFVWPQVKGRMIVSNKLVYTSCLTSYRTTKVWRSSEIRKVQNNVETLWKYNLVPSLPPKNKILPLLAKLSLKKKKLNFFRSALYDMETRVLLIYFVRVSLWKQCFGSKLRQLSWNSIFLTILLTLRSLMQMQPKNKKLIFKKMLKFALHNN